MGTLNAIQTGEVVALGWTLLHFCWQSTAIAILYVIADRCTVRASASVRYGIALGTLTLFPVVAAATFIEQAKLVSHVQVDQKQLAVSQLGAMHAAIIDQIPMAAPSIAGSELWIGTHAALLLPWVDAIWLVGVLLLALRAAGGWWRLRSLERSASEAIPPALRASFNKLAARYRLSRRILLRVSDEVISPMVFGIWRTVVLIPLSAITSLSPQQMEAVLAHELAHIRRWDYLCNLLQTSVECLFFFQPAVWWLSRRARDFREVCCDEVAAKACADPAVYAEALLHMEEQRTQHMRLAMALHGDRGTLLNRIRHVMGETTMDQKSISGIRIAAVGVVLVALYAAPQAARGMKSVHNQSAFSAEPTPTPNPEPTQVADAVSPAPAPAPSVVATPAPLPAPAPVATSASEPDPLPTPSSTSTQPYPQQAGGMDYLQKMRDAGYPLDLNKDFDQVVALRSLGVTPEYAKGMAQAGLGTPSLHDLVALKSIGITPEYVTSLKGSPLAPTSFHEAITTRSLGLTPEYAASLESLGLGKPTVHDLVSMKSMGITPEYVASLKGSTLAPSSFHDVITVKSLGITPGYAKSLQSLGLGEPTMHDVVSMKSVGVTPEYLSALKASGIPPADLHEAVSMKAVGVTPEYASSMAAAGFSGMSAHELIAMRAQGMTPEYAKWLKSTFPDADSHAWRQAATFHIDADFIAKAKSNGFNSTSLDKLVKLKLSGLLN